MNSTLIVITGPTGVGKTEISLKIAGHFKTVIVSADSRQIFREMKIGTAVPSDIQLQQVKHYFIGSHSIHDYFNASRYEEEAIALLGRLFSSLEIVLMTGGSMLYIDAVCKGIDDLPDIDPEIRKELITQYEKEGIETLRFELKRLDPEYYKTVDLQNYKRLLRALEICRMTGRRYSEFRTNTIKKRPFHIIKIGLDTERAFLYERINSRVDKMVTDGMEEEARLLFPFRTLNALNTVGYQEWFASFEGKINREEAIGQIKSNSRRYARKQLTWFKKDPEMKWFDTSDEDLIIPWIENRMNE
jgi:tRNA dimethylallyltransferase